MKYFVTGGLGVIGSRFIDVVLKDGHEATIIDAAEEARNEWTERRLITDWGSRVTIIKERMEHADLIKLIDGHDAILHAAAYTGIPHSEKDPDDDWISNVDATRWLLEALRKRYSNIPTVMLSSVKPYKISDLTYTKVGDKLLWDGDVAVDESFRLEPDEPYAASKMAQSGLGMAYARSFDLPVVVLRCSNLYGDAPCHGPRHGWLTWFCISAAMDRCIELQGTGYQTRDMLFSDDVASAVLASMKHINYMAGNVYNIGGGINNTISCREAIALISNLLERAILSKFGPGRKNEDMVFVTNYNKFHDVTGWTPEIKVHEGVSRILDWAVKHAEELKDLYRDSE